MPKIYSEEFKAEVREKVRSGLSHKEVALEMGCSRVSVRNWSKEKKKETERVQAMWTAPELVIPEINIFRHDSGDTRWYYTINERFEPDFHLSVTSLGKLWADEKELADWKKKMGDKADEYMMDRADYGTYMHILCADYLLRGLEINADVIYDTVLQKIQKDKWTHRDERWIASNVRAWQKDLLAFGQWVKDYNFRPIAIEIPGYLEEYAVAGTIDLVGYITIQQKGFWLDYEGERVEVRGLHEGNEHVLIWGKDDFPISLTRERFLEMIETKVMVPVDPYKSGAKKGLPKETGEPMEILVIVDLKSGRKGFYKSHKVQLAIYWLMWKSCYSDQPCPVGVYNWSPKDWRWKSGPSYNFTDQTDAYNPQYILDRLSYSVSERRYGDKFKLPNVVSMDGYFKPGDDPVNFYSHTSLRESIIKKLK